MKTVKTSFGGMDVYQIIETDIGPEVDIIFEKAVLDDLPKMPWLYPNYVSPDGKLRALSQSFLVAVAQRVVIVDTCIGNDKVRTDLPAWSMLQTDFLDRLAETGFAPDDVTDVLCTHLHCDHVGWSTFWENGRWRPTFPNAQHYYSRLEYDYLHSGDPTVSPLTLSGLKDSIQPIVDAGLAAFVEQDADLGDGIRLLPTAGHTPGHVSVVIGLPAGDLYITGDAIHHPLQIHRCECSTKIDFDPAQAAASRYDLLRRATASGAYLAGTHFSLPSIVRISVTDEGRFAFNTD